MTNSLWKFFTSLRLTVVCLAFAVLLVFFGTVAQVNEGLYQAQNRWFRSFFVLWGPHGADWRMPIFPGGYLIGTVLLVNLIAAHIKRFKLTWKKLGINITHVGIILLLVGQLATDLLSNETQMSFAEGETKNFSESALAYELIFMTDAANPADDEVVSISEGRLRKQTEIKTAKLPFTIRVQKFFLNARIRSRGPMVDKDPPPATNGAGAGVVITPVAEDKRMDGRNLPGVVIELVSPQGSLGTWLAAPELASQEIKLGSKSWRMAFRLERYYAPFSVQLLKTTHEVYLGTDTPKNFQSRIRIEHPAKNENREVDIYMNNPLRYEGLTFYQYQMGRDQVDASRGTSVLQVVRNPSWLTPYVGCATVGGGLVIQFLMHLIGFIKKRRTA